MLRILATIFAALLGLAFGSFLNVCLSRWPEGESIVKPRSHCRACTRPLLWWENIPVLSWLALGGRCRTCNAAIRWRYPLIEAAVGTLWGATVWSLSPEFLSLQLPATILCWNLAELLGRFILYWLLVALAALDAENLWLPDILTIPGIVIGLVIFLIQAALVVISPLHDIVYGSASKMIATEAGHEALNRMIAIFIAAALILLIRWVYWLFRRQEGIGLGDAKLMALLAAWLGLPGALLSFFFGVILGALVAVPLVMTHRTAQAKLPLGTFLCIGGIISALWGQQIIAAYLSWAGF